MSNLPPKFGVLALLTSLTFFVIVLSECTSTTSTNNKEAYESNGVALTASSSETCDAPANWFKGATVPTPRPQDFPRNADNCDFHQISWQYFLWLTEEVAPGMLRFETFYTDKAIYPEFKDDTNHILGGVQQANSHGILVDQNGRAVYTTLIINNVYRDFVLKNKLYDPKALKDVSDTLDFPTGSMSLKAAWKIVEEGENTDGYYTRLAEIELLATEGNSVVIPKNPKTQKNVKVALVGLHIAVVVEHHPEFIWATFEHVKNAPNFQENQRMNQAVASGNFTFYKGGTTAADCNQNNASIISLDATSQKLTPITQVARQYRVGGGKESNQNNIDSLNSSVLRQIDPSSLWKNFTEVGAVWFDIDKGVLVPNWSPNSDSIQRITGSVLLSSSVIETFTQNVRSENECFSCHNTMALLDGPAGLGPLAGKNVSTSHILLKNYQDGSLVKR